MIADKMKNMVANSSAIRAMFEEGTRLAGIYGRENVFDFSLGKMCIRDRLYCVRMQTSTEKKQSGIEVGGCMPS